VNHPSGRASAPWPLLAAAIPLVLTLVLYWPLPGSFFWADDFMCMQSIVNDGFVRFVFRPYGGHNLLVRNLVFYTFWHLFGLHAAPYFWAMLLTHLLNVWLLFRVLRRLTGSAILACFGATLWGTSPLAAGVLAWYAVFGQALVATILLGILDRLAAFSRSDVPVPARTAWFWYGLLLLGSMTFGEGIGVALAFPAVLFAMQPAAWRRPRLRAAYLALPLVTLAVYVAYRHLYPLFVEPLSPDELNARPAGIVAMPQVLAAVAALVAFSASEYVRNFFSAAGAYPDRATPLVLAGLAAGLGLLCWRGSPSTRRTAAAMASLCVGVYLAIALGRWGGDVIRTATQQRYHYVAAIPIVILVCVILQEIGRVGWLARVPRAPLLLVALVLWIWGFARSPYRVELHAGPRRVVDTALSSILTEVSQLPPGRIAYLENGANSRTMLGPVMRDVDLCSISRTSIPGTRSRSGGEPTGYSGSRSRHTGACSSRSSPSARGRHRASTSRRCSRSSALDSCPTRHT
jgi:hypothetical protein